MNPKVFINYRREDTAPITGRLYDRLMAHFGKDQVFVDILEIEPGEDFDEVINGKVGACDIAIVVIGPHWLHATDASGKRRLDDECDFVRMEIVAALERNIRVIPVLVGGAQMPRSQDLPEALAPLSRRNGIELTEVSFHADVFRLTAAIEKSFHVVKKEKALSVPPLGWWQWLVSLARVWLRFEPVAAYPKTRPAAPPEHELAEAEPFDVFVSHSTHDRKWVEQEIIALLKTRGLKPWYSKQSINTASQWEREILCGCKSCQWFLLVVSPRSAESEWVKNELYWAFDYRPTRIVPVIMERCNLWDFHMGLPRIQHVDFTTERRSAQDQLVETFRSPTRAAVP